MLRSFKWSLFFLVLLATGCSTSQDVVVGGPFQKRKYRPGWNIEFRQGRQAHRPLTVAREKASIRIVVTDATALVVQTPPPIPPAVVGTEVVVPNDDVLASSKTEVPMGPQQRVNAATYEAAQEAVPHLTPLPTEPEQTDGLRRWNRMALVSGVFLVLSLAVIAISGGGPILGYLLSFSFITGVIGLLLAIKHKEKGKGIAIAAIAFPVVLLALVIAALNVVW